MTVEIQQQTLVFREILMLWLWSRDSTSNGSETVCIILYALSSPFFLPYSSLLLHSSIRALICSLLLQGTLLLVQGLYLQRSLTPKGFKESQKCLAYTKGRYRAFEGLFSQSDWKGIKHGANRQCAKHLYTAEFDNIDKRESIGSRFPNPSVDNVADVRKLCQHQHDLVGMYINLYTERYCSLVANITALLQIASIHLSICSLHYFTHVSTSLKSSWFLILPTKFLNSSGELKDVLLGPPKSHTKWTSV